MMNNQKKKFFGIIFSALLISLVFLMKNIVGAAVDSTGNTITGTDININNVANYTVSLQFSGFLDTGDVVTAELIDAGNNHCPLQTYTGMGIGETGTIFIFDATLGTGGILTISGSVSGTVIIGPITATVMLDQEMPTFTGATSGITYTTGVTIEFFDNNPGVTATLNSLPYTSGTQITGGGIYIFELTDVVGNSTGASFIINIPDSTPPVITNITSGQYLSGSVTPNIVEINYSGTVVNFSGTETIYNTTGFTLTGEGYYFITAYDITGNFTGLGFTIDRTLPTFTGVISGAIYYTGVTIGFFDNNTGVTATLSGVIYTGQLITATGAYEFVVTDLAGNFTGAIFTIATDVTGPTGYVVYTTTGPTNTDVFASITGFSEEATGLNVTGHNFTGNGTFVFTFQDLVGNTGETTATVSWIDKSPVTGSVNYSITGNTNQDVLATITFNKTGVVGVTGHTFTGNGTYNFTFTDTYGNTGSETATVSWIDKSPVTGSVNYSITGNTNQDVLATITFNKTGVIGTTGYLFTGNDTYNFTFTDTYGNTGSETATVSWIDKSPVTGSVVYSTTGRTSGNVTAEITGFNKTGVIITSSGTHIFTNNGSYIFTFTDVYGNTGSNTATVTGIDKTLPIIGTGVISLGNTGANGPTGYYNGTITIKAIMSDAGAGISGATCEYSTGISRASATYTGGGGYCSITITPNADIGIRFRAQDIAGNVSTGGITTYTYDGTAPTTTNNANSTTGSGDVRVTLTGTDVGIGMSGTLYCVDTTNSCMPTLSGTLISVTGAALVVTHKYVRYYSLDRLGNSGAIETSAQIHIDKETPTLTGTTIFTTSNSNTGFAKLGDTITIIFQSHETLTGTPTITISGGSNTGSVISLGSNIYSGVYTMKSGDPQGIISFNIGMMDLVGNTGIISQTSLIKYDSIAPAGIAFTNPTNTSYRQNQTGSAYRDISRSTGSEINFGLTSLQIEYSINMFGGVDTIITTGTNNDGSYHRTVNSVDTSSAQMRIFATDLAGNTATFTSSGFKIDSTPPTGPTFIYPTGSEFLKGGSGYIIRRTGGIDANLSGKILQRSTDGGSNFTTLAPLADDSFTYIRTPSNSLNSSTIRLGIYYIDKGGLTSPYIQTTNFIVDSTAPTLSFIDTSSARRNTNATGTATGSDSLATLRATGILYRTDTQFDQYCSNGLQIPPVLTSDGTGYIYACVQDKAGNVTTGVQMYKIDKTAPLLSTGADIITNIGVATSIIVTGDVSGILSYARSKLSGTGTITFSSTGVQNPTVSANTDGTYVLQIVIRDNANNITTGTINFTRHTIAPVLTGTTVNVANSTATFTFTGNEAGNVAYSGTCGTGSLTSSISGSNRTTFTLANATYSGCQLKVTDSAGNASSWLLIPTFTVNYTAPSGGGGGGGGGTPICLDTQLMCTNGKYVKKTGVSCQGGNLDKICGTDICVDGDYSGNPSDGLCKDSTKVEASTGTIITGTNVPFSSPFNKELTDAYFYAYNIKITTVSDIKRANLTGILIRSHLAKMMSEYAIKVLGLVPNTARKCVFSDMQNQSAELKQYAITACQLGLMGLKTDGTPADKFSPNGQVDRAIFGATLSRALRGEKYNGGQNRYIKHLEALYANKIISNKDKPFNRELRGYVLLMMMRADKNIIKSSYLNFTSLRGTTIFVPNTGTIVTSQLDTTELGFLKNINKSYQFFEGYTAGQSNVGVKYLQYFLKVKKYYTGSINGINTQATVDGLFQFQLDNSIVADANDTGAGYLGPTTRETINPLLKKLLNP